jgi:hypothetical protein
MNSKFNLGSVELKIPANDHTPEINLSVKDISYEVSDMSITEYAGFMKTVITEVKDAAKEFASFQMQAQQQEDYRSYMQQKQPNFKSHRPESFSYDQSEQSPFTPDDNDIHPPF